VEIRELSREEDGDGRTYLKIEPLHAPSVVYETGNSEPTPASSPVPTPTRFEATALRYKFIALDPENSLLVSPVKEWTATIRLKSQLHNRGDHYEAELLALPKTNGIVIRYTTDGSSPTTASAATYAGMIRVPAGCRVVCAIAVAADYGINSEIIRIAIPQPGKEEPSLDVRLPARWNSRVKLDDAGAVWDFIQRLSEAGNIIAHDVGLTAESADGLQHVEYSGAVDSGYNSASIKAAADKLQEVVGAGALRMSVGSLGFPTGQSLLDWLKASNQSFDTSKVKQ
jgi:hypothetical protein